MMSIGAWDTQSAYGFIDRMVKHLRQVKPKTVLCIEEGLTGDSLSGLSSG